MKHKSNEYKAQFYKQNCEAFVVALAAAVLVLKTVVYFSKPRFMECAVRQYKDYAFNKLTQKSISAFNAESTASYISAFSNDVAAIESGWLQAQFDILSNLIMLVGAVVMMLIYSPAMTVISCVFFCAAIAVSYVAGNRMETAEKAISDKNSRLAATLKDALVGFSVIKSFKAEDVVFARFSAVNASAEREKCGKRKLATAISGLSSVAAIRHSLEHFLQEPFLRHRKGTLRREYLLSLLI